MYCTNCGTSRPDGVSVCPNCGAVSQVSGPPPAIQNYLVPSIIVTLCCCVPAGIVGIVYASQVNPKLAAGDFAGAEKAASMAKTWTWVGFGLGLVGMIIYGILVAIGAVADSM